jgi:large subunit ribosomal protein L6
MSRVAKMPVVLVKGVDFSQSGNTVTLKGPKGSLSLDLQADISVAQEGQELLIKTASDDRQLIAMAGTTRALLANMVIGVGEGFECSRTGQRFESDAGLFAPC